MTAVIKALGEQWIDYAGLFPPAQLPLEEALESFLLYQKSINNWMLGRFVVPLQSFHDLEALLPEGAAPLPVTLVSRDGSAPLPSSSKIAVEAVELTLSDDSLPSYDGVELFIELPRTEGWQERLAGLAKSSSAGIKLRCGGIDAAAFPSVEEVAFVLVTARDAQRPVKFTAGLHHPLRHYSHNIRTYSHGFLNVYTAALFAYHFTLPEEALEKILSEEDAAAFDCDGESLSYGEWTISAEEIRPLRDKWVRSFGSCSFIEPQQDLQTLGLL